MDLSETSTYYPGRFLAEGFFPEELSTHPDLLILNQPIAHFAAFSRLWEHTRYRICADGGANRLFDMFQGDLVTQREHYVSCMGAPVGQEDVLIIPNSYQTSFMETLILLGMM